MDEAVTSDTTFTSPNKLNLVIETADLLKIKKVSTYFFYHQQSH